VVRTLLTIFLLFVYSVGIAGKPDTTGLSKAIDELDEALLERDSVSLNWLLHNEVEYGHSNGWIEKKGEVIRNLYNGKLQYKKLIGSDRTILIDDGIACVRSKTEIDILLNGQPLQMKLHVLQVWIRKENGWTLLSRQSTKISN